MRIRRGEIYFAELKDGKGSEQAGLRPVLVVQNDIGNMYAPTVIVIPITSEIKRDMPTHVDLGSEYGLYAECIALAEQITTLDNSRLGDYIGTVDDMKMLEVDKALKVSLGVDYDD